MSVLEIPPADRSFVARPAAPSDRPVVYVLGPYRASTPWLVEQNIRMAEEVAADVVRCGAIPLCPHSMTRFIGSVGSEDYWVEATLEMLRRCDAAVSVPGWQHSRGSLGEVAEASVRRIPVFHDVAALRAWMLERVNEELRRRIGGAP